MITEYDWVCLCWSSRSCPTDSPCKVYDQEDEPIDCLEGVYDQEDEPIDCLEGYPQATSWDITDNKPYLA
jgi:hypothetical protein